MDRTNDGDLPTVLADRAPDIVMFDVPPPERGVRGIEAYRQTWPGFFRGQTSAAASDLESLDVVAGVDVAFAYSLLRCGRAEEFEQDSTSDYGSPCESEWAAMARVAELLGVGSAETVRKWCRQAEADAGARPGVTSEASGS